MRGTPPHDAEAVEHTSRWQQRGAYCRDTVATTRSLLPRHGGNSETRWQQRGVCCQDTVTTARHGGNSEERIAKTRWQQRDTVATQRHGGNSEERIAKLRWQQRDKVATPRSLLPRHGGRNWELVSGSWSLVREPLDPNAGGWYSKHFCVCRRAELPGRSVKGKAVYLPAHNTALRSRVDSRALVNIDETDKDDGGRHFGAK